jgi:starch phosphorylase
MSHNMGWAIGKGEEYSDPNYQDQVEAEALYDLLERDVIPTFYERGVDRTPRKWVERMKACVDSLCHFVNTHRMVRDYVDGYYMKAHAQFRLLEQGQAQRTRDLAAAMQRIQSGWQDVWVAKVEDGPVDSVPVSSSMSVRAQVHLGRLTPGDVLVELYVGRVDGDGNLVDGEAVTMRPEQQNSGDTYTFALNTSIHRSGLHGFTVRVRPYHPDMPVAFIPGLICWADESRAAAAAAV